MIPITTMFAPAAPSMWAAVGLVALAASAHQGWSTNLLTSPSDMFPRPVVASASSFGGAAGMGCAFLFQRYTGAILQATHGNYTPVFAVLGLTYLTALGVLHLLAPRMEPAKIAPA